MNMLLGKQNLLKRGFTIVELIIVVGVIGILITIGTVAYNGVSRNALDNSIIADLDTLAGVQTQYALKNDTGGKDWYSPTGVDSDLNFTPSQEDTVIDVVANSTDYCMRAYNPRSSYSSLELAFVKGSDGAACDILLPSLAAQNDSPPSFNTLTWTAQTAVGTGTWRTADISGDGLTMVASAFDSTIRLSKNGGNTWTTIAAPWTQPQAAAIDQTGQNIIVTANQGFISNDGGSSFASQTIGGICCGESVAISGDGNTIVALDDRGNVSVDGGYVYTSSDAGASWTARTSMGIDYWRAAAVSENGTFMMVASNNGRIFTSSNSGVSWTQRTIPGAGTYESWEDAAMSSDGQVVYIATSSDYIYKSTDAGVTWSRLDGAGNRPWYSIDTSSDGSKLVAGLVYGTEGVYTSTDSGITWQENSPSTNGSWSEVGITSNGTRIIAGDTNSGGSVWVGVFGP